ncbi:MAG: tRNA (adenosine(37)-N6)-threonylcarbamoyltransferase complex dimerization subunit type 1 TsaB [Parabacteroides sp.]
MALILNIETSTAVCSAALTEGEEILFEQHSFDGPSHASLLGVYVERAIQWAKSQDRKLEAVAVSCGPGSYTGLRIGVSVAKGLCFGASIPLISVPTLSLLASTAVRKMGGATDYLYCAMIDARRMEVYAALFDASLQQVRTAMADIVDAQTYTNYLTAGKVCFFGDGAAKCQSVIADPNACFLSGIYPLAAEMAPLSAQAFAEKRFEDVAYFEPFYLKEFQATIAKNKVLGAV